MKLRIAIGTLSVVATILVGASAGGARPAPTLAKTPARYSDVTGEYTYKRGAQESSLFVKQLPGHKIKFAISSLWIGGPPDSGRVHTGQAGGEVPLHNSVAVYKALGMTLTFTFSPSRCKVKCDGLNYYGGVNVDPNGTYIRRNRLVPTDRELTVVD